MYLTTGELKKLYDLLVLEVEGRQEHDLEDDPEMDSALSKIGSELIARGVK